MSDAKEKRRLQVPVVRPCEVCGKVFECWCPKRTDTCSFPCKRILIRWRKLHLNKPKPITRVCEQCGKSFESQGNEINATCSKKCMHKLIGRKQEIYQKSLPTVWYNTTCVICGKEFKVTRVQFAKKKKACSKPCFRKLCQQNGLSLPLLSQEAYRIIGEKTSAHPKTGHFLTNFCAKEYSLLSPAGDVFVFRNLNYLIKKKPWVFAETLGGIENVRFASVRSGITQIAPWRKDRARSWHGWTWHDPTVGHQPLRRVILSLGSNIEPRRGWIEKAVREISALPDIRDLRLSPLYDTPPEDVPEIFRDLPFLNGIVTFEARVLCPREFLKTLQAIEDRLGRTRAGVKGTPRTIDIDIIDIEMMRVLRPELLVPHPLAATRRFVLRPLADLLPDYRLQGQTETVSELLRQLDET